MNKLAVFLLATVAIAAPVQPNLVLSNFQSSVTVDAAPGYAQFGGFEFGEIWWGDSTNGYPFPWLRLGGITTLQSSPVAQSIHATASVDFSVEGYWITGIRLFGHAEDVGYSVSETFAITSPCYGFLTGADSYSQPCAPPPHTSSGTITAALSLRSEPMAPHITPSGVVYYYSDSGAITFPSVALTLMPIHAPEPGTLLLVGGVVLVFAWKRLS